MAYQDFRGIGFMRKATLRAKQWPVSDLYHYGIVTKGQLLISSEPSCNQEEKVNNRLSEMLLYLLQYLLQALQ